MMIEQNTNYAYKLKYIDQPSFDKVRKLAVQFMMELPQQLRDELYEALNHGLDVLDSEPQMVTYLYSFGQMHQAKLNYAFGKLPDGFLQQNEINIIDYGCGQAIGTMCYADYLRENGYSQKVKTITLMEPSEICLKRAALHASIFFPDVEIKTINKKFDDLAEEDIVCDKEIPTLHILSNVLDLEFDLKNFASLVKNNLEGYNQFVCVGPYFGSSDKGKRTEVFCSLLDGNKEYFGSFDKNELVEDKTWTAQILSFSVGKLPCVNLSTSVTDEEIDDGVEDVLGVLYSSNGKKVLKCYKDEKLLKYSIKSETKTICNSAFFECKSLQQIVIPNTVTNIGDNAFSGCISLRKVIVPKSVTSIGHGAFMRCFNIELEFESDLFIVQNGLLIDNLKKKIISCFGEDRYLFIPYSIKAIGHGAFYGCDFLQQIFISRTITEISDWSFGRCESLQYVDIPNTVTNIGDAAFYGCESLILIKIPDSITYISDCCFAFCESLQQIIIPDSVKSIGDRAFEECVSLQQITIPCSVTSIGELAFADCLSLEIINIPNSVKSIGEIAFGGCISLQKIIIPCGSTENFKKMLDEELWDKLVEE